MRRSADLIGCVPISTVLIGIAAIGLIVHPATTFAARDVFFEKDIRPILKAHCFHCHGEDGQTEAGLDLRLRRLIVKGGDSGPALIDHDADESVLVERIVSGEMPPGDKSLPADAIDLIRNWIDQGAKTAREEPETIGEDALYTEEERNFWAFRPLTRPAIPVVTQVDQVNNPIDAFILSRMEPHGLRFSKPAERYDLLRRLSFDLTGLPPTPDELRDFDDDHAPDATDRLIDRYIASPHYGERWGRHWLDVAGYADSEGYSEEDRVRDSAYRYRDYVVRSINADKPWDEFIREQLAGDEMVPPPYTNLDEDQVEKLTATGFLRMAPDGTASGGIDQNLARNQTIADTIDIVSTSLLGMTVACAQCHNHRYDPISQVDYYRMRAIFEPAMDWKQWRTPASRRISLYSDAERAVKKNLEAEIAAVEKQKKSKTDFFIDLTLEEELEKLDETLREPLRSAYKTVASKRSDAQKQMLAEHPSVQNISPGSLYLYDQKRAQRASKLDAARVEKVKRFIANVRESALAALPPEDRVRLVEAEKTAREKRTEEQNELIGRNQAVLVTEATLKQFDPVAAAEIEADKAMVARLRSTNSVSSLKEFTDQIAAIRQRMPEEGFVRALTEQPGHVPETFVFFRGDHDQPKQTVSPGDLSILGARSKSIDRDSAALPTSGRRLEYARHLTSGRHPLVARVIANRVWAQHFGQGIVASLGDFGMLGDRPTHPQLLDWLACELVDGGWSVKRLNRLITTSRTYQQSSSRSPEKEQIDPDNLLYARQRIQRLEAESYRDSVLAVSGQIDRTMYGPPVPVREDEVGQIVLGIEMLDGERKPVQGNSQGGQAERRSVYVQVRRSRPLGVLETFDRPVMTPNCTQRNASNVAPQPLMQMNSDFAVAYSGKLAERLRRDAGEDPNAQITLLWKLTQGHQPSAQERSAANEYLQGQAESLPDGQDVLATLCHALLSTNRFLYVD